MNPEIAQNLAGEDVAAALESLGEDVTADRINEVRDQMLASRAAGFGGGSLRAQVAHARDELVAKQAWAGAPAEKPFEVGGLKFSAVRMRAPSPHWRLRIVESGEVMEAGTGSISNESVPKMQASVEEIFRRASKGDPIAFRAMFNLPEPGATPDLSALASAFQAVYYTGKRMPSKVEDLEACWGREVVDAIARHMEGGTARVAGASTSEERVLADNLHEVWQAIDSGEPYSKQVLRGPEFKEARSIAMRFAPDWKKCVAPYEERYARTLQSSSADLSI